MKETKIEWTDHSWSPWRGCTKVSPGCANCYAEGLAERFNRKGSPTPTWGGWGKGKPRVLAKNWNEPLNWDTKSLAASLSGIGGKGIPFSQPPRPTVFPSLCDWLDDEVSIAWLARFLQLVHVTNNLNWLLLTKRPENFTRRISDAIIHFNQSGNEWMVTVLDEWNHQGLAPSNVWIGTSVEDQQRADERIPELLKIPAVGRFLSVEPMIGPVDLEKVRIDLGEGFFGNALQWLHRPHQEQRKYPGIDWVIIGGESGPRSRLCNVEWIRSIVDQCASAEVPCFVKQLGSVVACMNCGKPATCVGAYEAATRVDPACDRCCAHGNEDGHCQPLKHPKGGDPAEWPDDLRVRQFPTGFGK